MMKRKIKLFFLCFVLLLCVLVSSGVGANTYIFWENSLKADVKGDTLWESKAVIKVEDPSVFPKVMVWRYNAENSDLAVERLRLRRADGRLELLALEVTDYGSLVEKKAFLEGLRSGDMIEISFSLRRATPLPPYFWWHFLYPQNMDVGKLKCEVSCPVSFLSNESFSKGLLEKEGVSSLDPFSPPKEPLLISSLPSWERSSSLFSPSEDTFMVGEVESRLSRIPSKKGKLEVIWKILSEKRVLEGWSFSDQGYKFSSPKKSWERKEVTPSDLSFLAYSMLKSIGLSPEMVWVSEWPLNEKYPVPSLLSHPLVRVVVDDKTYWLDPYALSLPPGYIHPRFQGGRGIVFSPQGVRFINIPVLPDSLSSEEVDFYIELLPGGSYTFNISAISRGWLIDSLKRFSNIDGVKEFNFETKGGAITGKFSGKGNAFIDSFGKRIVVTLNKIGFPLDFLSLPIKRKDPIDLGFLRSFEHNLTLKYPKNWKLVSLPLPFSKSSNSFSISAKFYEKGGNKVCLSYSFRLKEKILSSDEWASLLKGLAMLEDYIGSQLLFEGR